MRKIHDGGGQPGASGDVFCPFIKTPRPECHCVEMNGRKINLAMRFCLKDYKNCRIYRRLFLQEARRSDETDSVTKGGEDL